MSRACVIGAGAAGLCAARHLLAEPSVSAVDVLEQAGQVGGTWVYTEDTGYDDFGLPIHTSMYKSLRQVMRPVSMERRRFAELLFRFAP
ncbi:hypothetical protein MSG28_004984 [Choristoneura fumiferana]|uniref:Uncharacterized protein n=1 Tax=Choristoneura fumiferana TaxID=7141 RepID=A0ACC0JPE2_CHOFU|nr:hypothetical protein MSG28_004984 [Choristoneura fumiferana]